MTADISNDPFMTHDRGIAREMKTLPASQNPFYASHSTQGMSPPAANVDLRSDPFMRSVNASSAAAAAAAPQSNDVASDPFLMHSALHGNAMSQVKGRKNVADILGPGDPGRKPAALRVLVLLPFLTFVWMLLLWLFLRHFSQATSCIITIALTLWAVGCIAMGKGPKRGGSVSFVALGVLCLVAVGFGYAVGHFGWHRFWRQLWWTQTGYQTALTSAETPAMSRIDSGVIDFTQDGKPYNGTIVDPSYSAGYKKGSIYCVAPVLDPYSLTGGLARVNYWAIGIDCCQTVGSFTCDGSRQAGGGYGVVMLEEGMPCPGCNRDNFMAAVAKAEAVHGLVSARGALFVRWAVKTGDITFWQTWQAVLYMLFFCFTAGLLFYLLGYVAWYQGYGRMDPATTDPRMNAGRSKFQDNFAAMDNTYATMNSPMDQNNF